MSRSKKEIREAAAVAGKIMESTKSTIGRTSTDQRCIVAPCRTCGGSGKIATSQYIGPCQACDGDGRVVFTGSDVDLMLAAPDLLKANERLLALLTAVQEDGLNAELDYRPSAKTEKQIREALEGRGEILP